MTSMHPASTARAGGHVAPPSARCPVRGRRRPSRRRTAEARRDDDARLHRRPIPTPCCRSCARATSRGRRWWSTPTAARILLLSTRSSAVAPAGRPRRRRRQPGRRRPRRRPRRRASTGCGSSLPAIDLDVHGSAAGGAPPPPPRRALPGASLHPERSRSANHESHALRWVTQATSTSSMRCQHPPPRGPRSRVARFVPPNGTPRRRRRPVASGDRQPTSPGGSQAGPSLMSAKFLIAVDGSPALFESTQELGVPVAPQPGGGSRAGCGDRCASPGPTRRVGWRRRPVAAERRLRCDRRRRPRTRRGLCRRRRPAAEAVLVSMAAGKASIAFSAGMECRRRRVPAYRPPGQGCLARAPREDPRPEPHHGEARRRREHPATSRPGDRAVVGGRRGGRPRRRLRAASTATGEQAERPRTRVRTTRPEG